MFKSAISQELGNLHYPKIQTKLISLNLDFFIKSWALVSDIRGEVLNAEMESNMKNNNNHIAMMIVHT